MQPRKKIDLKSAEARAYRQEVRRSTFTREGLMVAFPTCFPGVTTPIPADESRITALDALPDGTIYGGTSGRQAHLFVAGFHAISGIVFDLGPLPPADSCAAVCCGETRMAAFLNGPRGGRALVAGLTTLPADLIQEWGFRRPEFQDLGECVPGEPVLHAVAGGSRKTAVGITAKHLFALDLESPKITVVGEVPASGRVAVTSAGSVAGFDGGTHLWLYHPRAQNLRRRAVPLPGGTWDHGPVWARDPRNGLLYTADRDGRLFSFDESAGFQGPLAQTHLAPVSAMAVTLDGRVFGFCGEEMANMFCYHPARRKTANLGVALSVIERRRYGYAFADAVTGPDGEIVFAEDDNLGHLWLYFPRIEPG